MIRVREAGRISLAVLASGRGSNFDALCQAVERGQLDADIKLLLSDRRDAPALEKAARRGIESFFLSPADFTSRDNYEVCLLQKLREHGVEIIALAGYMRLVGKVLLQEYKGKIINIHPALLPSFPGLNAQSQALNYGVRFSGCTVHIVDEGMDTGPILMQAVVPVYQDDDEDSLAARILVEEHQIYWRSLQLLAEGRVFLDGRRVVIADKQGG
ncbi:phosphoribosylglycinamide formyltransferase [Syntrophomonas wolfei]|uniref:Phosphoribosylglycinamide formyltransferase n=1 Tax=Syntrophomonas wolfei subsp. wolfei (strain DSM 2245B / Goettingen) TaxID=335541 RepID=Q0AW30_SYNWW|nr:phosphoribosylglycinamide formyltransferase [Syntrophomonas wolfei]ABI69074.1 phosphoribosylglycinamide formyltransferase [Syntrophomonas wolfei subsp. wolfei str. Goettingen G311]